jgi:hypothetical protein
MSGWRRLALQAGPSAAAAIALVVVLLTFNNGGDQVKTTGSSTSTTRLSAGGTSTTVPSLVPRDSANPPESSSPASPFALPSSPFGLASKSPFAAPSTPAPAGPTSPAPPTTTAPRPPAPPPVCRNSFNPACGAFRWDPAPAGNRPMVVELLQAKSSAEQPPPPDGGAPAAAPETLTAGQRSWFSWRGTDPDALPNCWRIDWGDGTFDDACAAVGESLDPERTRCQRQAFGPWTPRNGFVRPFATTVQHTYAGPGAFRVVIQAASFVYPWEEGFPGMGDGRCLDPYRSVGALTFNVAVQRA